MMTAVEKMAEAASYGDDGVTGLWGCGDRWRRRSAARWRLEQQAAGGRGKTRRVSKESKEEMEGREEVGCGRGLR